MAGDGDDPVQAALKVLSDSGKKYIPESDLIAAKKGLESQVSDLQGQVTTVRTDLDAKHQALLSETAARQRAESSLSDQSKLSEQIKALQKELGDATKSRDEHKATLVELKRLSVAQRSNIPMDQLATKTEAQLDALDEALKLVKPGPGQPGYDGGTGGTGGTERLTGRQQIKAGLKDRGR